jgi:hypothetical protein
MELPVRVDGKVFGDQFRQFFGDIAPHAVIARERLLRRIDIETGAKSEIVGVGGIAGHAFAAGAGVGRNEDQSKRGAGAAEFTLFRHVGVGAGQAGKIPDHRQPGAAGVRRHIDREGHVGPGFAAGVSIDALCSAV